MLVIVVMDPVNRVTPQVSRYIANLLQWVAISQRQHDVQAYPLAGLLVLGLVLPVVQNSAV